MLTRLDAIKILNIVTDDGWPTGKVKGHGITGYDLHDDGEDCDPDERYWGEIFVEGLAHAAAMGPDPVRVANDLALTALRIAVGREETRVAVVIKDGLVSDVSSDDTDIRLAVVDHDGLADDPATPNNFREFPKPWEEMDPEDRRLAEEALEPA